MKYRSHIGMDFRNQHGDLFSFQLVGTDGIAYAGVDLVDGIVNRFYAIPSLFIRKAAIIRLAESKYNQARQTTAKG